MRGVHAYTWDGWTGARHALTPSTSVDVDTHHTSSVLSEIKRGPAPDKKAIRRVYGRRRTNPRKA